MYHFQIESACTLWGRLRGYKYYFDPNLAAIASEASSKLDKR